MTVSSFCPIQSFAITATHTSPVFLGSHLINLGFLHA